MYGFNHKWRIFIFLFCIATLLGVLSYNNLFSSENLIENVKVFGIIQTQKTSFGLMSDVKNFFANLFSLNKIIRENDLLKKENYILKNKMLALEVYGVENKELKELLKLDEKNAHNKVSCAVIGRPPSLWFSIIYIDKGEKAEIEAGFPVVNKEGLVGKIDKVFKYHAQVLLATDPDFVVPCKLPKTGDTGLLYGYKGKEYIMKYIDSSAKVNCGDIVVTSKTDKISDNIPVGVVKQILGSEDYMYKELIIKPSVKASRLRYMYVFRK